MKFLETIQRKPKKTRVMIMWLASALVMLVIIIVWLVSFSHGADNGDIKNSLNNTQLPSLIETLKKDFSDFKKNFNSGLKILKDQETKLEELNEGQETE